MPINIKDHSYQQKSHGKRESSLHHSLKFRYTGAAGETEVPTGDYICDGINETGEIIEVQTGSFGPLKDKIKRLAYLGNIRIIHPIIMQKHIELYDIEGNLLYSRKSPRKGTIWDLFKVLLYAPELPLIPELTIELALVAVKEQRCKDGLGSWRRKGIRIIDKCLAEYYHAICLRGIKDYYRFIPFDKYEQFTVRDLGNTAGIKPGLARKTLYVLTKLGIIKRMTKKGNAWIYKLE
jgi:hypothetical protein